MKLRSFALAVSLCLASSIAAAGQLTLKDNAGFLTPAEVLDLQGKAPSWPFDVTFLSETGGDSNKLEDDAHLLVTTPKTMVIAIDPSIRRTSTRFGTETNVKVGDYDAIAASGNAHFRVKENGQGIEAIVQRAQASSEAKAALTATGSPVVVKEGLDGVTMTFVGSLFLLCLGIIGYVVYRNRKEKKAWEAALNANREEMAEMASRNIREQYQPEPAGIGRVSTLPPEPEAVRPTYPPATTPEPFRGRVLLDSEVADVLQAASVPDRPIRKAPAAVSGGSSVRSFNTPAVRGGSTNVLVVSENCVPPAPAPVYHAPAPVPHSHDQGGSSSSYGSGSSSPSTPSSYDSGGSSSSYGGGSSSDYGSSSGGGGFDSGGGSSGW